MTLLDAGGIMAKDAFPTGVEKHGDKLRICFHYKGKRVRENLGVPGYPQKPQSSRRTQVFRLLCNKNG